MSNRDPDNETFTRVLVALALSDTGVTPTRREIEQMADELLVWSQRLKLEFQRAQIADRIARLSRAEVEAQLAARIAPTGCCTQRLPANDADSATLSDDDLRARLVDAEVFVERMAA
jgi:hypothetical protein